ncbi:hypothetical protein LTR53_006281 [Teratosphaeriaceae sp. CCFEE 6253]|nr:hypothetical protein LTR53_006281 [Teratosphaeriaceae sp. CCFEE 6253]
MSAFGFSVGDLLAGANLIVKATKALRSSGTAVSECESGIIFLQAVEESLRGVYELQDAEGEAAVPQRIRSLAEDCCKQASKVLSRIEKYQDRMVPLDIGGEPSKRWKRVLTKQQAKVEWALVIKKDLVDLMGAIHMQLDGLQMFLQQRAVRKIAVLAERQDILIADTRTMHAHIRPVLPRSEPDTVAGAERGDRPPSYGRVVEQASIKIGQEGQSQVSRSRDSFAPASTVITADQVISSLAMYLWQSLEQLVRAMTRMPMQPTLVLDTNIELQDALGRTLSLPYEHFSYWPCVVARLESAFDSCAGEMKVWRNQFAIFTKRKGAGWTSAHDVEMQVSRLGRSGGLHVRTDRAAGIITQAEDEFPRFPGDVEDLNAPRVTYAEMQAQYAEDDRDFGQFKIVHWTTHGCRYCSGIFTSEEYMLDHIAESHRNRMWSPRQVANQYAKARTARLLISAREADDEMAAKPTSA